MAKKASYKYNLCTHFSCFRKCDQIYKNPICPVNVLSALPVRQTMEAEPIPRAREHKQKNYLDSQKNGATKFQAKATAL